MEKQIFKFRAEGYCDVHTFLHTPGIYDKIVELSIIPCRWPSGGIMPDVEVELEANASLDFLLNVMSTIEDGHVMIGTIQPIDQYTGERDYGREMGYMRATTSEMTAELRRRGHAVVIWGVEDVDGVIENHFKDDERLIDNPLTEEEKRTIIERLDHNHDCNFGITWEHVNAEIEWLLDNRLSEEA